MWMDAFARAFETISEKMISMAEMAEIMRPLRSAPGHNPHRSSGTLARRQWKRRRASGITKRVRA